MKEIKMWLDLRGEKLLSLFQLVPGPGLEPGRPKTGDFKAVTVSETLHSFLPIWREIGRSCRSEKPTVPYRLDTGSIVLHRNRASLLGTAFGLRPNVAGLMKRSEHGSARSSPPSSDASADGASPQWRIVT
jgi:hypothetical protein